MQQNIRNSLVLVMLLTLQWSYATDFLQKVKFFGVEQGLSNQTVHSIHQGSDGFIWIGTSNGLNRYDGYNFQQWTKNNSDLSFSNIKKILEDDAGNLWLFDLIDDPYHYKLKAINLFSLEDNKIVLAPKNLPFPVEQVAHFFKDAVGNIWFYTQQAKLWKYHSTKGFTQHQIPKNFQPRYTDDGSNWWGIRQNQFLRISGEQKQVLIEQLGTYKELNFAIQDQSQQLWLSLSENRASDKRVYAIKDTLVKSLTDELYAKELWGRGSFAVATIEESFNQSIVLGFGTDLVLMDLKTKEILYTLKQSIFGEATQIQAIQKDYKGNIWIGTTVGLFLLNIHKNPFRTIQPKSDFSAYRTFGCRALIRSGEALLVQSDVGRFSWNLKTNQFQQLEDSYSYSDNKILCYTLHRGSTGKIWMSSDLLAEIDSSKGNILNIYQPDNQDTILDRSWSIYEDRNERLWLNLNSALYTFDQKNNRFEDYTFESSNRPIPQRKWQIYQIQKDEVGLLWLASNKGLYALNPEKKHLVCYWSEGEGQYYLPANDIYHFHIDQAGVFWLATANSGLIRWNPKASEGEASIRQLTSANGLSSNTLCAVYEDEREQLWISSFRGIMQIDKNTFQCKKYLIRDGIADLEYNRLAHHQDAQGNIYFGGLTGITAFHPKNFSAAPYDAALVVSTYKQYQSNLEVDTLLDLTTDFRQKGKIELFPNSLFFTLDFSLQDYFYNEETTYQYKIEQFHRDWIELNTNRLEIAGLPWGEHILKVKAKGADGRFSIQELSIPIVVHVPLLLKPWMLLFYTLALIFVVWFFVQLKNRRLHLQSQQLRLMVKERTQKIEQQAQHLKALNEQQSRFFANISHELRTPLTLILSPANKLSQQNYSKEQQQYYGKFIQENAQTLLHRINDLLALSKLDADQLKLQIETAELGNFLKRVIANIDSYALQKGLTLELNYLIQHPLYLKLDLQKINQILINFLTNSIKFTDSGGKINLTALEQEQSIQLSVSDTGIGLAPEDLARIFDRFYQAERDAYHQGTGIGLALCKELANLMDGEIWAESKLGEGSIFYFRFPK
ncbi:MAG: ATP-binding protein, partial [Bacteroidota bacterium]